jgi:hypothetical protein
MPKKRKQYKDYDDYIASPEWKAIKKEFYDEYDGLHNICEISLKPIKGTSELHHWNYPKDWSNDSIDNLVLVSRESHQLIHDEYYFVKATSRNRYIQIVQSKYFNKVQSKKMYKRVYSEDEYSSVYNERFLLAKIIAQLNYDKAIKITTDLDFKITSNGNVIENDYLYINGIKLSEFSSSYIKGFCQQEFASRNKYGSDYNVNFNK